MNKWNNVDKEYLINNYKKLTIKELSIKLNRSVPSIKNMAKKLKIVKEGHAKKVEYNENLFKNMNKDLSYLLGFFMADGYLSTKYLRFAINHKDIEVLKYLSSIIFNDNKDRIKCYGEISILTVASSIFVRKFEKYNIFPGAKTWSVFIPKEVIESEFMPDFIRGYFDGDGWSCFDKNKKYNCGICSGVKEFLVQIQSYLGFGRVTKCGPIWKISFSCADAKYLRKILYPDNRFALSRKKENMLISDKLIKKFCYNNLDKIILNTLNINNINEIADKLGRTREQIMQIGRKMGKIGKVIKCQQLNS